MRILTISDLYPPDIRGGAEVITRDAVEGLRDRGHDVIVATAARGPGEAYVRRCLEYRESPRWQGTVSWMTPWRTLTDYRRAFHNHYNEAAIEYLLAEVRPDIIYLAGVSGAAPCSVLSALRDCPAPVIAHLHEYWLVNLVNGGGDNPGLPLPPLKKLLMGVDPERDLRFASMIAVSRTVRERYVEAGFDPGLIEVIPNGLRLPPPVRGMRQGRNEELRLLFVGRLDYEKGAHILVERLAGIAAEAGRRPVWCDIIGPPGPPQYMRKLQALISRVPRGHVRLLGASSREVVLDIYPRYDAVVVPSLWREPFSLVVPEALVSGTAVIASRNVGATEWFEDGRDLLLFASETPWELDRAIRRLRDTPGQAARLARSGGDRARLLFDPDRFIDRLEEHLLRVLARSAAASDRELAA